MSDYTEEVPATPGWVETELDSIFSSLPRRPTVTTAKTAYADCLAGIRSGDPDAGHDRCRARLLQALEADGIDRAGRDALHQRLEALEAEITTRT